MATAVPAPVTAPTPTGRQVTFKEALALLDQTGYGVKESTLRRWFKQGGVSCTNGWYSYADILELHRDRVLVPIFGD